MTRIMRELRGVGECISSSGLIGWYIVMLVVVKKVGGGAGKMVLEIFSVSQISLLSDIASNDPE